jgi:glycosyltransferase involved in cell wall biosynthesis
VLAYCPVDGPLADSRFLAGLAGVARLVLYTEFGRRVVAEGFREAGVPASAVPPIEVIPHGTDAAIFHPLCVGPAAERRARAREELFGAAEELQTGFIGLNANRNTGRKRIDLTIEGFARFAADKPPDVRLYLHSGILDGGTNLLGVAKACGVLERIVLTGHPLRHPEVPDATLNLIYNACDVGINTSAAEGWGLCSFEHAATRAAQVVPSHTACAELWSGAAVLLEPEAERRLSVSPVLLSPVSTRAVASALQDLYEDPGRAARLADAAFHNATRPEYSWDGVARRFDHLLRELVT